MNNSQQRAWEQEYRDPNFISCDHDPQQSVMRLIKWLKKEGTLHFGYNILQDSDQSRPVLLDLGCGIGRNLIYIAREYGAHGYGYDFSPTAIIYAKNLTSPELPIHFETRSIGEEYPLDDESIDIVIDITASHALYEGERDTYLSEVHRVLKPNGLFYVRTLCIDGDTNARNLLKLFPGPESDTYLVPQNGMMEKVFSEKSFRDRYGHDFEIIHLSKPSGYQKWGNQSFKRRYIVAYMKKKSHSDEPDKK